MEGTTGRLRDFRLLWVGQGIASVGTQITVLALPLTAILTLHANAAEVGWLNSMQWLPFLLLSLYVGVLVDRLRRRPLMILADAVRAVILGAIVTLASRGWLNLPILWGLVLLFGSATVVFELAYNAYLPGLVDPSDLLWANSRLQATSAGAQLGGPALGGVIVQLLTAPMALLGNALSFIVSVATLGAIGLPEPVPAAEATPHPLADVWEGLQFTYANRYLRSLIAVSASYNLFNEWILTLYVLYAVHSLHLSPAEIGLSFSGSAVGAFVGAAICKPAIERFGLGASFVAAVAIECLAALIIPLSPSSHAVALPLLIVAFGLMDFGATLSSVAALSVRQSLTPNDRLGRMTASYRVVAYGCIPLGAALGGLSGQWLGLRSGLLLGALALLSTIGWAAFSPLSRLGSIEDVLQESANV